MDYAARIRRNLRVLLRWRDMTARDFAARLGWDESMLSRRLGGKTAITATEVGKFAEVLEVEPGVFYKDPDDLISSRCYLEIIKSPFTLQRLPGIVDDPRPELVAV